MAVPQPLLVVQGLGKSFAGRDGQVTAVDNISFSVKPGELVGFIGPNGAGKSTTMRLLTGVLAPDSGTATICGHDVVKNRSRAQEKVGYLAEQPATYEDLNVYEYLEFLAGVHNVAEPSRAIDVVARLTRCADYLFRTMGDLSKGMKQRANLAGALIHNPPVLILDEPTDGLDPNQKHELRLTLKELAKTKAVLVSTHILDEAEAMCSRVVIMHNGKLVADTTPAALAKQAKGDIQLAFRLLTTEQKKSKAA